MRVFPYSDDAISDYETKYVRKPAHARPKTFWCFMTESACYVLLHPLSIYKTQAPKGMNNAVDMPGPIFVDV